MTTEYFIIAGLTLSNLITLLILLRRSPIVLECPHAYDLETRQELEKEFSKSFGRKVVITPNHMRYRK